ncbi:MAG: DUF4388 domain-containing protein [Candidatus Dadabacteria bacterium]|nr:MAG: DUF4388 domain-containing protein [Candidatus Dadabacteria bacterium]
MPLQGDFGTMTLEELLQWLYLSESSGTLLFRCPNTDIRWGVAEGRLVDVRSNSLDRWAASQFGPDRWQKAKLWADRDQSSPVEILQKVGLLRAEEVGDWLQEAGRRSLHAIFMWNQGWFLFENGRVRGDGVPIEHLLLDVTREYDERIRVRERLGNAGVWVEAVPGADLSDLDDVLAEFLRAGVHLAELGWLLPDDLWDLSKTIYAVVGSSRALLIPPDETRATDPVRRYQEGVIAQRSFRHEEAAAAFEEAIEAAWEDPFVRETVDKWVRRYIELVKKHLVAPERRLERGEAATPKPGDPYAAWVLRTTTDGAAVRELVDIAPFPEHLVYRSIRRLAAAGDLRLS